LMYIAPQRGATLGVYLLHEMRTNARGFSQS